MFQKRVGAALLNSSSDIYFQNPEAKLEPHQTSKIELFGKIVNGLDLKWSSLCH